MGNDHHHHHHTIEYRADPAQIKQAKKEGYEKQIELLKARVVDTSTEYNKVLQQLNAIQSQIAEEEKLLVNFPDEYNDRSAKIIVLVGNTGDGKSTVGNRICGDLSVMADEGPFETSDQSASCTQTLSKEKTQIGDIKITVVDAPGWNDSEGKDRVHANNLCAYLYGSGGLNNFVLVRNAANYRFDYNFKLMLERYQNMFGKAFWRHLIVVLTRVEKGFSEQQFNRGKKDEDMRNHIYETFQMNPDECRIPVIAIGLDNYTEPLQNIINSVSNERFECEQIKSPLQELKGGEEEIIQTEQQIKQKIDELNTEIQQIQEQLDSL